ncbi:MAG: hypothetical protein ACK58T_28830 [Phycisphaerae bacterium]
MILRRRERFDVIAWATADRRITTQVDGPPDHLRAEKQEAQPATPLQVTQKIDHVREHNVGPPISWESNVFGIECCRSRMMRSDCRVRLRM